MKMTLYNLTITSHPILFAICMGLGIVVASGLAIWISLRKKEK